MNNKILFNSPDFKQPISELEQYSTPPDIAFEIIKKVNSAGNLSGKIADLGCGTGRLSIAAALLGANITGFEIDEEALNIAKEYSEKNNLKITWINQAIEGIEDLFDTVIMNPPFGSQRPGADKIFLEKAMNIATHSPKILSVFVCLSAHISSYLSVGNPLFLVRSFNLAVVGRPS